MSNEYATAYKGIEEPKDYILGDCTYETKGWKGDYSFFVQNHTLFFGRGGYNANDKDICGIFFYGDVSGAAMENLGFRLCLII